MADEEIVAQRPEAGDPEEVLKAQIEALITDALTLIEGEAEEEAPQLAQAPFWPLFDWEVLGWGPWQTVPITPGDPGRIIFLGEDAFMASAVFLSPQMAQNVGGFGGKIQLNYFTSNTQTMTATNLTRAVCIPVSVRQRVYVDVFRFRPTDAACLYETNICARICNCNNNTVPGYAAFVRHVFDFDPEHWWFLGPPILPPWVGPGPQPPVPPPQQGAGWLFDHPIRFLVVDPNDRCVC